MYERADQTRYVLKGPPLGITPDVRIEGEYRDELPGIRCPRCGWRPSPSSRWFCLWTADAPEPRFNWCGTLWNTFSTNGRCPTCAHQWRWTSCLQCTQWSLHEDWYEIPEASRP